MGYYIKNGKKYQLETKINKEIYNSVVNRIKKNNLSEISKKLNNQEYIDSKTLKKYKKDLAQYEKDYKFLEGINKRFSANYDQSKYDENIKYIDSFKKGLDSADKHFSKYKSEYDYNMDNLSSLSEEKLLSALKEAEKESEKYPQKSIWNKIGESVYDALYTADGSWLNSKDVQRENKRKTAAENVKKIKSKYNNKVMQRVSEMSWQELNDYFNTLDSQKNKTEKKYLSNVIKNSDSHTWNIVAEYKKGDAETQLKIVSAVYGDYLDYKKAKEDRDNTINHIKNSANDGEEAFRSYVKEFGANNSKEGYITYMMNNNADLDEKKRRVKYYKDKYGSFKNLTALNDELLGLHNSSSDNVKNLEYYNKMVADPNYKELIEKGKELYGKKDTTISDIEYEIAAYNLAKGEDKNGDYNGWLRERIAEREVASQSGNIAATDRERVRKQWALDGMPTGELAIHNAFSIPTNIVGGTLAFAGDTVNILQGQEINPNSLGHQLQDYGSRARGAMAQRIDKQNDNKEFLKISLGDAYQAVMSGIDSFAGAGAFGKAYPALMGTGAASARAKELYEKGASNEQIIVGGLAAGMVEMLFEKCSIGYFLDNIIDSPTKSLGSFLWKTLAQGGIEMSEESATEVGNIISDILVMGDRSKWSKTLKKYKRSGYNDSEAISLAFKDIGGDVWEAGVGGLISGGTMGAVGGSVNYYSNVGNENNRINNQTEQNVVNKEIENRIAEAQKDGTKLTNKQKSNIKQEVLSDLYSGNIDIDTIEQALGGDDYTAYKDALDNEDAIIREYTELENTKRKDRTLKQKQRLLELEDFIDDIQNHKISNKLKSKLKESVFGIANGTRLAESYAEKARRSEVFTADISQYDEKLRPTLQKAIDSGILNNTNKTRDMVENVAKISADLDVEIDFYDTQKLKEMGYTVENRTVNGIFTKEGNIGLNVDSAKAWQSVVGHEVTHKMQKSKNYEALKKAALDYAKAKGDYQSKWDALVEKYNGVETDQARLEQEFVADIIGDYVFTDEAFVKHLCDTNQNIFKKFYNEIKHLLKLTTAGSKEYRQLEKVKHTFDKVYSDMVKQNTKAQKAKAQDYEPQFADVMDDGDVIHSLSRSDNLDNVNKIKYNDIKESGDSYARTDEFRKLQEESRRMSDDITQSYHSGSREVDGEIRGRLSRTFRLELHAAGSKRNYSKRTLLNPKSQRNVNVLENVDGELFHDVFEIARHYLENGELVDLHETKTTEDGIGYDDCINYLSEDGLSGFSITPNGDLISVFNLSDERGFLKTISPIVKEKAKTLDCYASSKQNLMVMYQKIFGFKTAATMDYNMEYDHDNIAENHQSPQVAFMVNTSQEIETKHFGKDDYEAAVEYRDSFIKDNQIAPVKETSSNDGVFFDTENVNKQFSLSQDSEGNNATQSVYGFEIKKGVKVNEDLLEELQIHHPAAEVDTKGNITVYHRTTKENADSIYRTGTMSAKEDALFFSSKKDGYATDYGDTVVALKIPSTELLVNDIFDGEVHFEIPLKYVNGQFSKNVSQYLVDNPDNQFLVSDVMDDGDGDYSLSDDVEISDNDIDFYTEEQYNNFGWVRKNNVLTAAEYSQFNSCFANHKIHNHYYVKTKYGKSIIPVGKNLDVLVYANGDIDSPKIFKIVKINLNDEYNVSEIRSEILGREKQNYNYITQYVESIYGEGILRTNSAKDFPTFQELTVQPKGTTGTKSNEDSTEFQDGTGSIGENNEIAPVKETSSNDGVFFDTENVNKQFSLSDNNIAPTGKYSTPLKDLKLDDIAPISENIAAKNGKAQDYEPQFADVMDDGDSDVDYSLSNNKSLITNSELRAIQSIGRKNVNDFTAADIKKTERFARRYFKEMGVKSPFFRVWFGDWRANDNTKIEIASKKGSDRGVQQNTDTGWNINVSAKVFNETKTHRYNDKSVLDYLPYINDIVEKSILLDSYGVGKAKSVNSVMMHTLYCVADIGNGKELLKLYVEEINNPNSYDTTKRAYQLQNIEKASVINGEVQDKIPSSHANTTDAIRTISDLVNVVKIKDKNYTPKSVNPVLLNADGTPKVFYHGTGESFTEFKPEEMAHREGSYFFAENREDAAAYGKNIFEVYLTGENLADYDNQPSEFYRLKDKRAQVEWLKERGYDGWYADMDSDGWGEVSVFEPTQIKSATDNIGTFDGNNPDIRYSISDNNIAPTGKYSTPLKDLKLDDIAPISENVANKNGKVQEYEPQFADVMDVRYSISKTKNMSWNDQIEGALNRGGQIKRNDTIVVGNVANFLINDGVSEKPLAIPLSIITKAKNGKDASHSISESNLKKLDSGIQNANLIIDNPTRNALVYITDIVQNEMPIMISFQKNSTFDGDNVHKATSIHLQADVETMLKALPTEATVYVINKNELYTEVGVTNNLRSLAANVKFIDSTLSQDTENVNNQFSVSDNDIAPIGEKLYSISKTSKMPYNEQLKAIEEKELNGSNSLYVGVPSIQLQNSGFSNAPFAMNQSDYRKSRREEANNKHYSSHSVAYDFFENMPQYFSDAPMLIDNGNKVSVITTYQMNDTKDKSSFVIGGVWQNQQMDSDTVNLIKSVYPLDDFKERIPAAAENGKLVVVNKNKADQMLNAIGIQPSEASRIVNLAKSSLSQQQGFVNDDIALSKSQIDFVTNLGKRLGRTVIVEDLRNRVVKDKIASPDGFIDNDGVIHISLYAQNPVAFVFKHELTHFCERSKLYKDFVKQVENSRLYKDWLCAKTGKKYLWEAEDTYKQKTLKSHPEIRAITDPKLRESRLQAELMADFVGKKLFTDNGSGMTAIIAEAPKKQRSKIIRFILDFISYLKKKLSGNYDITFRLSVMEDSFNRMLFDATNGNYTYDSVYKDGDVAYCFLTCKDEDLITKAEQMENNGALQKEIWSELNVIRNGYSEWVYDIGTHNYGFFCNGNSSHDKWFLNKYKAEFSNDKITGRLGHFVRYKRLFAEYVKLKFYNVVIEYADVERKKNTVYFDADKKTFYIDKALYDKVKVDKTHGEDSFRLKSELLRQLQIAVMDLEGHNDYDPLSIWKQREQRNVERKFSKYYNRYYTGEEMYESQPVIHQADMSVERFETKRIMRKTGYGSSYSEKSILPHYPYERLHFYDKSNRLVSVLEHDRKSKDPKLGFFEEPKYDPENTEENFKLQEAYNEEYESYNPDKPYDDSIFDANPSAEEISKQNSRVLSKYLINGQQKTRSDYRVNENITAGNTGYFERDNVNYPTNAKQIEETINRLKKIELNELDTAGRRLDSKLMFKLLDCAFKNENGMILSFFRRFTDSNATDKMDLLVLEFGPLNDCLEQFFDDKKARPECYNGTFAEYYLNSVKPLIIDENGWNTINIIRALYDRNEITEAYYNRLLTMSEAKDETHKNIPSKLIVEKIRALGYDSIVYIKDNGKISVSPLYSEIIMPVAENGIATKHENPVYETSSNKENDDFVKMDIVAKSRPQHGFEFVRQKILDEPDNTQKLKLLAEAMISPTKLKKSKRTALVGSSGFFEKGKLDYANGYRRLKQKLAQSKNTSINDYDTAGRKVDDYVKTLFADSVLKDADGKPISLFMPNRFGKNRKKHAKLGLHLSNFNMAIKQLINSKLKHPDSKKINLEEYYVMASNSFYLKYSPKDFSPGVIALEMFTNIPYNDDTITEKELDGITSLLNSFTDSATSSAATRLKKVLKKHGYDSIVYMNNKDDPGSMSVIVFDESQLIPVSVNGSPMEKYEGNFADSTEPAFFTSESEQEGDLSNNVEKGIKDVVDENNKINYNEDEIINDGSHIENGQLKPNVKYRTGEYNYCYQTDTFARVVKVYVERLFLTKREKRLKHNTKTLGKQKGDHAGHLIGDRFGGSAELDNLVSQSALANLSAYKRIENRWAKAINRGKKVSVYISVLYEGSSTRPSGFKVGYIIDKKTFVKYINN